MADKTEIIYDLIFNTQAANNDIASLNVQLKTIQDNFKKFRDEGNRAGQAIAETGQAYGKTGTSIQNASYQVADFFTQVNGGTSAARALSQQLPQLLAGFGVLGAAAGAAVAIFAPLIANMVGLRDYAKETDDALKAMNDNLTIARTPLSELSTEYGNLGLEIRKTADALAKMNALKAEQTLREQAAAALEAGNATTFYVRFLDAMKASWMDLKELGGVVGDAITSTVGNAELYNQAENNLNKFRSTFSLTAETTQRFGEQYLEIQRLFSNGNFEDATGKVDVFKNAIYNSTAGIRDEMIPVLQALQDQLTKAGQAAVVTSLQVNTLAKTNYGNTSTPGESLVYKVGGSDSQAAKDAAKAQKKALSDAAAAARKAESDFKAFISTVESGVTPLQRMKDNLREAVESFARFNDKMSPEQVAEYSAYIDSLNKKIDELTFKERWDKMAEGIKVATDQMSPLYDAIKNVGDTIQSSFVDGISGAFMAFIEGTKSAQDAFKEFAVNFLKEITAMIIKSLILYAIQSALGMGTGGGLSGILGRALNPIQNAKGNAFNNGRVMAFASGGVVNSPTLFPMAGGRTGMMGEAGPEAIIPLTRRNGKLGVEAASPVINIINNAGAQVTTRQNGRGETDVIIDALAAALDRGGTKLDGAMARGFGLRRQGR